MKNSIFLLLFLNLYLSRIDAQINKDSIINQLEKSTTTDEERYKLYNQLSRSVYIYSNPDSSLYYAKQHQKLADKNGNFEQIRRSSDNIGVAFIMAGEYDSAQLYYNNLIKLIIEEGAENHLSPTYTNIGACYLNQGNFPMALDYYFKALAAAEKFNQDKAIIYNMLGVIYRNLKKYDEARNYTIKSLELAIKQNHKKSMAESSCNLGLIYDDEGNLEKALEYYQESHDYAAEIQDELIMHNVLENMALIYCQQEEYLKAEVMLLDVLAWWEEYDDKGSISNVLGNIGNIQIELGRNNEAIETCKRAYDLSVEINALSLTESACNCLYRAYKNIGNTKLALDYHEQLSSTSDSLFNEKNTEELTRLEMQFDFDKKELLTNQELKRQKILRNGFLGGFLVVFAFSGIVFAQRNRIRKEKHRSDELLLNILPEEIAEELKSKGSADAKLIDHVTVLFTDFKGFTELSEQLSAKELVETINECFSAFDHIMEKYGIEKIKTIGDAYMAAGGLPTINETHPADVVLAALEIQAFIQQEKEKRTAANKLFFEVRIGIHSGPVVAGIVGVKKFQYDIWGDTVNIASRMESSGEVGKVNISGDTYALVKDKFNCLHRGKIHAKGKGEIDMYFVEGTVS